MRFRLNKLIEEYRESKGPGEDIVEWFLKRKARMRIRFLFAYTLWAVWIFFWFRPDHFIYMLEGVFVFSIFYSLFDLVRTICKKYLSGKSNRF